MRLLALALVLLSHDSIAWSKKAPPEPTPIPQPTLVQPVPTNLRVNFAPVKSYATQPEIDTIRKAGEKLDGIVASSCFGNFMLKRRLIQTDGRSNQQVLDHIRSLRGTVPVVMYTRCMRFGPRCPNPTSAVAYRQPPETKINLNRVAFNSSAPLCDWASVLAHESLGHSLGEYDHSYEWNSQRQYSVPYSLNAAVEACCF